MNTTNELARLEVRNFSVEVTVLWDLKLCRWVSSHSSLTLKMEELQSFETLVITRPNNSVIYHKNWYREQYRCNNM
jgi:hypothetical protein